MAEHGLSPSLTGARGRLMRVSGGLDPLSGLDEVRMRGLKLERPGIVDR